MGAQRALRAFKVRCALISIETEHPFHPREVNMKTEDNLPVSVPTDNLRRFTRHLAEYEPRFDAKLNQLSYDELKPFLARLNEREFSILATRYGLITGEPKLMREVGVLHGGIGGSRARQILVRSEARLALWLSRWLLLKDVPDNIGELDISRDLFDRLVDKGYISAEVVCKLTDDEIWELLGHDSWASKELREAIDSLVARRPELGFGEDELDSLELSARPRTCLARHKIRRVSQLCEMTEKEVADLPYLGDKSLEEIKQKLQERGLGFKQ